MEQITKMEAFLGNKTLILQPVRGYGEIGRRTRLRIWRSNPCRFDPYYPHHRMLNKEQRIWNVEVHYSLFLVRYLRSGLLFYQQNGKKGKWGKEVPVHNNNI